MLLAVVLLLFLLYYLLRPPVSHSEPSVSAVRDTVFVVLSSDSLPAESSSTSGQKEVAPSESRSQHPDTLHIRTDKYPGPPQRTYYPSKLKPGATVDVNTADTLLLQRVPGIGPSFARRIYKYRQLLGGYYCVEQLQEVYGMDREKYDQISPYVEVRTAVQPIDLDRDTLPRHPYLQWQHRRVLEDLIEQNDTITWEVLKASGKFSHDDYLRLNSYLPLPYIRREKGASGE